jgi:hypothetical protein
MIVAVILILLAVVAVVVYMFGSKPTQVQLTPVPEATIIPTVAPTETPIASESASPIAISTTEIKLAVTNYLKSNGYDMSKVSISEPQKLGTHTNVYSVGWTEIGYVGGGQYVVIGKMGGQWTIPGSGDAVYCEWINSAGLDEATKAFMGSSCDI